MFRSIPRKEQDGSGEWGQGGREAEQACKLRVLGKAAAHRGPWSTDHTSDHLSWDQGGWGTDTTCPCQSLVRAAAGSPTFSDSSGSEYDKVKHAFIPSFYSFTQQTPGNRCLLLFLHPASPLETGVSQTGLFLGFSAGCGKGLYTLREVTAWKTWMEK